MGKENGSNNDTRIEVGLEDVVAAKTSISHVDGAEGTLSYRGYDVKDLARHATYEETSYLLLYGDLPNGRQLAQFVGELAHLRRVNPALLAMLRSMPGAPTTMDLLRTLVSAMSALDSSPADKSPEANLKRGKKLIAQLPTLLTAHLRIRQGEEPLAPRDDLSHAANLYYMLHGAAPTPLETRVLDMVLTLMAEHDLNASTFAVRVVASTLSDLYAAFVAGLGALNGPLHGAANSEVMKMLLEIGSQDRVEAYVGGALAAKRKIMGFGHRVYKTWDPRAVILREMLKKLDGEIPNGRWCTLADCVQDTVFKSKRLYPNVDFYAAPALYGLGFPMEAFPPIFACSRSSGWAAHALEQYADNRLIRPTTEYTGPEKRTYRTLQER